MEKKLDGVMGKHRMMGGGFKEVLNRDLQELRKLGRSCPGKSQGKCLQQECA